MNSHYNQNKGHKHNYNLFLQYYKESLYLKDICIYSAPPPHPRSDKRLISFKQSKAGSNSIFLFNW